MKTETKGPSWRRIGKKRPGAMMLLGMTGLLLLPVRKTQAMDMHTPLNIRERPSPNFDERTEGPVPTYLILHYTGMPTAQAAEDRLAGIDQELGSGRVSAHYIIDVDGTVTRLVPEDKRAWHAGHARYDGLRDMNSRSIGIEIVNPGHAWGYVPFPPEQMRAVVILCRQIMARYAIPPSHVLGHSDIAPGRKIDPGELFDWPLLAKNGIGVWPRPESQDYEASASWPGDEAALRQALEDAGYDTTPDTRPLIVAFQRHYQPDVFRNLDDDNSVGIADAETAARLHALIRLRHP